MRCEKCERIPLIEIDKPEEYVLCLDTFSSMVELGILEIVYQNYPAAAILTGNTNGQRKFLHQYRCKNCGTIYGMFVNTNIGGEIKINDRVFNPAEYPDKNTVS